MQNEDQIDGITDFANGQQFKELMTEYSLFRLGESPMKANEDPKYIVKEIVCRMEAGEMAAVAWFWVTFEDRAYPPVKVNGKYVVQLTIFP